MKTTLLEHLSLGPYKESVASVQIQMPFHAVGRSFRPSGGSYAPDAIYIPCSGMTQVPGENHFIVETVFCVL